MRLCNTISFYLILTVHFLSAETKSLTWTATTSSWTVRRDKRVETVLDISSTPVSWPVKTSYKRNVINFWVKKCKVKRENNSRNLNSMSRNYLSSKSFNIVYNLINFVFDINSVKKNNTYLWQRWSCLASFLLSNEKVLKVNSESLRYSFDLRT